MTDAMAVAPRTLIFFAGPMDSGKSTLALQMAHTQSSHDRRGQLFTCQDRGGQAHITSRIGLERDAVEVDEDFNFLEFIRQTREAGQRLDFLICDEAQFYTSAQIDELAMAADEWGVDVFCFGLLSDCRTELWEGSRRLVEMADRVEMMPVRPLCWCGRPGTHTARALANRAAVSASPAAFAAADARANRSAPSRQTSAVSSSIGHLTPAVWVHVCQASA